MKIAEPYKFGIPYHIPSEVDKRQRDTWKKFNSQSRVFLGKKKINKRNENKASAQPETYLFR